MTERITLIIVSIACLTAVTLPNSVTKTEVVRIPYKPLMFQECEMPAVERERICRARKQSEKRMKGA